MIQYIHPSPFAKASLHFLIACLLSGEKPPCGAEPRIELGPALQQANALPTEPRRTIAEPRRTITEPRRTITDPRRTITEPRRTITEPRRTMTEPRRTLTDPRRTITEPRRTICARLNYCIGFTFWMKCEMKIYYF
jgi:hypothetical protein